MSQQVAHAPPGYDYVRPLGSVGSGSAYVAYLATHRTLRRDVVVVEIPRSDFTGPHPIKRFRRDARTVAATTVGPIIRILEVDPRRDPISVVTEHVPGTPLTELLENGALPAARALPILEDVAAALRVMASQGLAHGDVGPEHVVVLPHGRARLGGFAVSRALSATEPDQWSDAHAFAVLAHRTLTGSLPPISPDQPLPPLPWRAAEVLLAGLVDRPRERPLPHELMEVLRGIPGKHWTSPPDPVAPVAAPGPLEEEPDLDDEDMLATMPPRWLRWGCIALGLVATTGAGYTGAYLLEPWRMVSDDLEVRDVSVTAETGPFARCPHAEVRFVARITTNGKPGELTISWIRPDGVQPPARTVRVRAGQDSVQSQIRYTFRGRDPRSGRAVVLVDGDDSGSAHETINYLCPGG